MALRRDRLDDERPEVAIVVVEAWLVTVQAESLLRIGAVVLIEADAVVERQPRHDLKLVLEEHRVVLEDVPFHTGPLSVENELGTPLVVAMTK